MSPKSLLFFIGIVLYAVCVVRCNNEDSDVLSHLSFWIEKISDQALTLKNYFLYFRPLGTTPMEVGFKMTVSMLQIFAVASGADLFTSVQFNEQYQSSAIAITNLCSDLSTMNEIYPIILNATFTVGEEILRNPLALENCTATQRIIDLVEISLESNTELEVCYEEEIAKAKAELRLPQVESTILFETMSLIPMLERIKAVFDEYPRFRYFIANTGFFSTLLKVDNDTYVGRKEHHVLAKSLLRLWDESNDSTKVQELFTKAMQRTADELYPATLSSVKMLMNICDILFPNIQTLFAKVPDINSDLEIIMSEETEKIHAPIQFKYLML